jgi:DNA-binding response OmpR family regulator
MLSRRHGDLGVSDQTQIVIVDDDPSILGLLERVLVGRGHAVVAFTDPRLAVGAVLADPPDLVVTDMNMPGMSGLDVIDAIRQCHPRPTVPILVLSANGDEDGILSCMDRGADDYLVKPLRAAELTAKVGLLISRAAVSAEASPRGFGDPVTVGDYRILRRLGEGGMGIVYEARTREGEVVALKILAPKFNSDARAVKRFLREVEVLRSVSHPHVAAFHGAGRVGDRTYLAMEHVKGPTLRTWVRGRLPLPETMAVDLALQLARAIDHLHGLGIVHRDLKPENIVVARGRCLKIIDFGLAHDSEASRLTLAGAFVGTVGYTAPEILCGAMADVRADLYALGVLLYWFLVGRHPFESDNANAILTRQGSEDAPSVRSIRPTIRVEVGRVVDRLLARDPAARLASPKQAIAELEAVQACRMDVPA